MKHVKNRVFMLAMIFLLQGSLLVAADVAQRPAFGFLTQVEVVELGECDEPLVVAPPESYQKKKKTRRKRSLQKRKNKRRKKKTKIALPGIAEEGELVDCAYCRRTHDLDDVCQPFCDDCCNFHQEGKCLLFCNEEEDGDVRAAIVPDRNVLRESQVVVDSDSDDDSEWEQLPPEAVLQAPVAPLTNPARNFGVGFYCEMCHQVLEEQCKRHSLPRLIWSPYFLVRD